MYKSLIETDENIKSGWTTQSFYNLYYNNNKIPFNNREEARKYFGETVLTKYNKYELRFHGCIIYYELTDGSKVLEEFIGRYGNSIYYKDSEWNTIGGNYNILENNDESSEFIKNKNFSWNKGLIAEFPYAQTTQDGNWLYVDNYSEQSNSITSNNINVENDNQYLSFVAKIYTDSEKEKIKLQVYDRTDSTYIYNEDINIYNEINEYPVVLKVLKGHEYAIMVGKSITSAKYYLGNPLLFSISSKPSLILFEHDVDKEIKSINSRLLSINSDWEGKNSSSYGDSVTAINNGDFSSPYTIDKNSNWGVMVAKYLGFSKHYGRGIGGQKFAWGGNGGSVAFINTDGNYHSRNDS